MSWASWNDFFAMGGYALYVWGSYAVTAGVMAAEVVLLCLRKRDILNQLGVMARHRAASRNRGQHETTT